MCGIVGVMGQWLTNTEKDIFKDLLTVSNLRGFQGAGVIISDNKAEPNVFKTTGNGTDLAHDPAMNERLFHSKPVKGVSALIGHTRWPTKGAVTLESTHPHEHDGIVGVHNGTIDKIGDHWVEKDESDSSLLFKSFAENGVRETIEHCQGAWCLVWIDQKLQTLNFLRNDKRPLFLAVTANGQTIFWASERGMLEFVLGRRGIKFEILTLLTNKWSEYELPVKHHPSATRVTELHGKSVPAVTHYNAPFLNRWTGTTVGTGGTIAQAAKGTEAQGESGSGKVIPIGTPPLLAPPKQQQQTILQGRPRMRWDKDAGTWVEINPLLSTPSQEKTISLGGTPKTLKNDVEKEVSASTDDNFSGDELLQDDGQMVGERDLSAGPQSLGDALNELFNDKIVYEGYRETIANNWMSEEAYIKCLEKGCLWCGDPQPDIDDHIWTDVDEFMCFECQHDSFAQDYVCMSLAETPESLGLPKIRKTA